MLELKLVLNNIELEEESLGLHKRLDYYEIAMTLLYAGTELQKVYINYVMKIFKGEQRTARLKSFIDNEVRLGRLEV